LFGLVLISTVGFAIADTNVSYDMPSFDIEVEWLKDNDGLYDLSNATITPTVANVTWQSFCWVDGYEGGLAIYHNSTIVLCSDLLLDVADYGWGMDLSYANQTLDLIRYVYAHEVGHLMIHEYEQQVGVGIPDAYVELMADSYALLNVDVDIEHILERYEPDERRVQQMKCAAYGEGDCADWQLFKHIWSLIGETMK
jgi:hypothetical protein